MEDQPFASHGFEDDKVKIHSAGSRPSVRRTRQDSDARSISPRHLAFREQSIDSLSTRRTPGAPPFSDLTRIDRILPQKAFVEMRSIEARNTSRPLGLETTAGPMSWVRHECPTGLLWKT